MTDFESACQMVHYYALRWTIERLHFTLKSGCLNVERVQIDDGAELINALALYYIVAWRVLHLTYLARTDSDEPADIVLTESEMRVLTATAEQLVDQRFERDYAAFGDSLVKYVPGLNIEESEQGCRSMPSVLELSQACFAV